VRRTLDELEVLERALSRNEERADSIRQRLTQFIEQLLPMAGGGKPECQKLMLQFNRAGRSDPLLKRVAEFGVESLSLDPLSYGKVRVRVGVGPVFEVSEALGALLGALAEDPRKMPGPLVDYKSLDDLASELSTRLGRPFKRHAVTHLISRLRKTLGSKGAANPWLVQTHSGLGARFALRRPPGMS